MGMVYVEGCSVRTTVVAVVITRACTGAPGPTTGGRRTTIRPVMSVHVGVGLVATTRRWRPTGIIGVVGVARAGRRVGVVDGRTADARGRARIAVTRVIVVARRRTTTVVVAARAVAARRTTTVVVIVRRAVAATAAATAAASSTGGRAGPVALTGALLLNILDASDSLPLEFAVVELLDGVAEIVGSLILNKSTTVALAANLGVDDVQSRLAGEVLQVL